ncbi:nuclear protein Qri2/Nse4 [Penicillium argentinense]|uniref:Non-structural maintenance of chromosomes element 4 n=1 Tax=Penicillium argentinense TaxID=1131581 RepID=A0A9W9FFU8_9EURO|nr:nuclear protein Qri2/Nse4 [Penicillium argentinense]KAJ5099455.1 nuclear protein Qri2/Nse4 [Penicillium argentinense]
MAPIPLSQLDEPLAQRSPPISPSSSSDKENPRPRSATKRTSIQMAPPSSGKRRRLTDRAADQSQGPASQRAGGNKYYDPDQDPEERRANVKKYRELERDVKDSRTEFLQSGNDGLLKIVEGANRIFANVKHPNDATFDSRLLVNAADLSHKKTSQLVVGDTSTGIDVDEFVSKCISFMRRGPESTALPTATQQRRRHRRSQRDPNASDDDEEGDAMNWDWLGRAACLPFSGRPAVSGFLLGPLSVEKRSRQFKERSQHERIDPSKAIQPQDLQQRDLGEQESFNLTEICSDINHRLAETITEREKEVDEKLNRLSGEPTPEVVQKVMDESGIADNGGIPFFSFCINPHSFGQSVENLFYVSFLVRDGNAGISTDSRGLPTLHSAQPYAPSEAVRRGIHKHQAIFHLDFDNWREIIDVFGIKECIIPHREEKESTSATWYG